MSAVRSIRRMADILRPQDGYDHEVNHDYSYEDALYFGVIRHILAVELDPEPVPRR